MEMIILNFLKTSIFFHLLNAPSVELGSRIFLNFLRWTLLKVAPFDREFHEVRFDAPAK
jgi:hypothetical protein